MLSAKGGEVANLPAMTKGYLSEMFTSFQGEGVHAGRRHLFIRLGGCNLRCRYCDTPDSLERASAFRIRHPGRGSEELLNPISPAEVIEHAQRLLVDGEAIDGVALTGGEPLLQAPFLSELLADDRLPRPRLLETNGMLPEPLRRVLPLVDVVSMDIKLPSNSGEAGFWQAHARFLELGRGKIYVKILVDARTLESEVEHAAALVESHAPEAPVFLQPITDEHGRVDIEAAQLTNHYRVTRRHTADVRVLPQTHKILGIA